MAEKPNCYDCKHRDTIPGNAHSRCLHPSVGDTGRESNPFTAMMSLFDGSALSAAGKLEIKGHPHGIASGWFIWPANFDPMWLESCNGFEPVPDPAEKEVS